MLRAPGRIRTFDLPARNRMRCPLRYRGVVHPAGVDPARPYRHSHLKAARLPIRPRVHEVDGGGSGRDRTAGLPLFRRALVPTELPNRCGEVLRDRLSPRQPGPSVNVWALIHSRIVLTSRWIGPWRPRGRISVVGAARAVSPTLGKQVDAQRIFGPQQRCATRHLRLGHQHLPGSRLHRLDGIERALVGRVEDRFVEPPRPRQAGDDLGQ